MARMRDIEDMVKFCEKHKVWYVKGEQPCRACQEEEKDAHIMQK